jgi:hypothetical protein
MIWKPESLSEYISADLNDEIVQVYYGLTEKFLSDHKVEMETGKFPWCFCFAFLVKAVFQVTKKYPVLNHTILNNDDYFTSAFQINNWLISNVV